METAGCRLEDDGSEELLRAENHHRDQLAVLGLVDEAIVEPYNAEIEPNVSPVA